jgi:hypothetical protein
MATSPRSTAESETGEVVPATKTRTQTVRVEATQTARILYHLNISNVDRLWADSGWIFARILLPALATMGFELVLLAPEGLDDSRITWHRMKPMGNKHAARFSFDVDDWVQLIRRYDPDVVVCNQVEQAAAVRGALVESGSQAKLVGYCHYLPFWVEDSKVVIDRSLDHGGLGRPILLSLLAGISACDTVVVHNELAVQWLSFLGDNFGLSFGNYLRAVPPPRDPTLVLRKGERAIGRDLRTFIAIYNHRLYDHYGTPAFLDLAAKLQGMSNLRIDVSDVLGIRSAERRRLDKSPDINRRSLRGLPNVRIVDDCVSRESYRHLLAAAHFAFAPFRYGLTWSMSVVDCQAMGLPVLAPRSPWGSERVHHELLFDYSAEALEIIRRLMADSEFLRWHSQYAQASTSVLDPDLVAREYARCLA